MVIDLQHLKMTKIEKNRQKSRDTFSAKLSCSRTPLPPSPPPSFRRVRQAHDPHAQHQPAQGHNGVPQPELLLDVRDHRHEEFL